MKALSLMYHDVVEPGAYASSGFAGPAADAYKLEAPLFRKHLEAIRDSAAAPNVGTIETADKWTGAKVFLTFDDGGESAHSMIAPLLETFGWRGHFFITTDRIGSPGFVTAAQARDLRSRGHVIGSHSRSHPMRISHLPAGRLQDEWSGSVRALEDVLGERVTTASVPGGFYSRGVAEAVFRAGVEVLFTSEPTPRPQWIDGRLLLGRYFLKDGMSAVRSKEFAEGRLWACGAQALAWKTKQTLKSLGGFHALELLWSWRAGNAGSR